MAKKDNELLVEFDFLIDLDLALFRLIQDKYSSSPYVDEKIIAMKNEYKIIRMLLSRKHINPLEIIMPNVDTESLYHQFNNENEKELLEYATPYDSFYLMITFLNQASSVDITVLCKNQLEVDYIKSRNSNLQTIICTDKSKIDLRKYTAIYMKYFMNAIQYKEIAGKYIYIALAKYNFEEDSNIINSSLSILYGDVNIIKLMDLYTKVKYYFDKGEDKNDLLEYSAGEQSEGDTEGDTWYNLKFPK